MRIQNADQTASSWAAFAHKFREAVAENTDAPADVFSVGPVVSGTGDRFAGAVEAPGGTIIFIPYSAGVVGRYDPATNTYSAGAVIAGSARFQGGCLTDTGIVVMAPLLNPYIGLYDPVSDVLSEGPDLGASPGFDGCCQARNGEIVFAPRSAAQPLVYNLDSGGTRQIVGPGNGFSGCLPMPSGEVMLIPYSENYIWFVNPEDDSFRQGPFVSSVGAKFSGGAILHDGTVVFAVYSDNHVYTYDQKTGTVSNTVFVDFPQNGMHRGAVVLPDGRVAFAPYDTGNVGIYNPADASFDTVSAAAAAASLDAFHGCALAANGKAIFAPYDNDKVGILDTGTGQGLPHAVRMSRYFNVGA
ncbi:hypothetical protein [Pseudooceanicola sp.]|uniref:hypothetical protein n=1 Tax=Pseudooceanicola sp. TaxID=1914328 RepID=UPI003514DAAA